MGLAGPGLVPGCSALCFFRFVTAKSSHQSRRLLNSGHWEESTLEAHGTDLFLSLKVWLVISPQE